MTVHPKDTQKFHAQKDSFWNEARFAWGMLSVSIAVATVLHAVILLLGYQPSQGMLVAAIPLLLVISGSFLVRETHLARRMASSQQTEIEHLLLALEKLSSEDRQKVIQDVLTEEYSEEGQQRRRQLFAMYILVWSLGLFLTGSCFAVTYSFGGFRSLAIVIVALVAILFVEGLPRAVRALRIRAAKRALIRVLA